MKPYNVKKPPAHLATWVRLQLVHVPPSAAERDQIALFFVRPEDGFEAPRWTMEEARASVFWALERLRVAANVSMYDRSSPDSASADLSVFERDEFFVKKTPKLVHESLVVFNDMAAFGAEADADVEKQLQYTVAWCISFQHRMLGGSKTVYFYGAWSSSGAAFPLLMSYRGNSGRRYASYSARSFVSMFAKQ